MPNETPILSWGVENIDQPAIKQAVSGTYQGLSDMVSSAIAELQDRFSRSPVEAVAGPRRGGILSERGGYVPSLETTVAPALGIGAINKLTDGTFLGNNVGNTGGVGGYVSRLISGEKGPGLGETLGVPDWRTAVKDFTGVGVAPATSSKGGVGWKPSGPLVDMSGEAVVRGLKKAEPTPAPMVAPVVTPAATSTEAAPAGPVYKYIDPQGNMGLTNRPESIPPGSKIVPLAQGRGVSGGSASGGVERSEVTGPQSFLGLRKIMEENLPKEVPSPNAEVDTRIDTAIERIKTSPGSLINVRGQLTLSPNALKEINELEKARITAHTSRESHQVTRESLRESAKDRDAVARERIASGKESAQALLDLRRDQLTQQKKVNEWTHEDRQEAQALRNADAFHKDHIGLEYDPETAKMVENDTQTYLKMYKSGRDIPKMFQPAVKRTVLGFETWYKNNLKGRPDTPAEKDIAFNRYMKLQSKYPQIEK